MEMDDYQILEADEKDEINTPYLPKLRGSVGLNAEKLASIKTNMAKNISKESLF